FFIATNPSIDSIVTVDNDSTLHGEDLNANRIRDDMEPYIDSFAPQKRHAVRQAAKAMLDTLRVDVHYPGAVQRAMQQLSQADDCLYETFEEDAGKKAYEISLHLEKLATNNDVRERQYN